MSLEPQPLNSHKSSWVRFAAIIAMALFTIGLQIGLPWLSFHLAAMVAPDVNESPIEATVFWGRRLRFEGLLNPTNSSPSSLLMPASGTVCQEEVIILLKTHVETMGGVNWSDPSEILQINLRTGRLTRSPVTDARWVLADHQRVWQLPKHKNCDHPFLWNGQPALIGSEKLVEFAEDQWRETSQFPLLPLVLGDEDFQTVNGEVHQVASSFPDEIWYRSSLPLGSQVQADEFDDRFHGKDISQYTEKELQETGWEHVHVNHGFFGLHSHLGYWFEGDSPCSLFYVENNETPSKAGFLWSRYSVDEPIQQKFIPSPIPWSGAELDPMFSNINVGGSISYIQLVRSARGEVYLMAYSADDQRMYLYLWDHGKLRLVFQQRSPLIWMACLDGIFFLSVAWGIPMLVLSGLVEGLQRREGLRHFACRHETVLLASMVSRGLARFIDLCLALTPLILSVVCHPDVMGWWIQIIWDASQLWGAIETIFVRADRWKWIMNSAEASRTLIHHILICPRLWWLFFLSLIIYGIQIVSQARYGLTLGKWLLGIKTVRTTLHHPGITRSMLREILFGFDSLMLLCWVPGVVTMLINHRSQRLGDLLSDTIVIRQPLQTSQR